MGVDRRAPEDVVEGGGRGPITLLLGPLIFCLGSLAAHGRDDAKAISMLSLLGWMSSWWLTEAVPVAITALLPAAALPIMGLLPAKQVSVLYCNDGILLVFGSFILATALKRWEIDKRLAIWAIDCIGDRPHGLLAVMMGLTTVIGCFMPNTSTASLMIPLTVTILRPAEAETDLEVGQAGPRESTETTHLLLGSRAVSERYARAMILGVAFSCSASGFATLTGTGSNLAFAGIYSSLSGREMGWTRWLAFSLPLALLYEILIFCLFRFLFCRGSEHQLKAALNLQGLDQQRRGLQPWSGEHTLVVLIFALCVSLWAMRDITFGPLPPWADYFDGAVSNGTVAIGCSILLFGLPLRGKVRLLDWRTVQREVSFSTIILLGGGFAMSAGVQASGLAAIITNLLKPLGVLPLPLTLLCLIWLVTLVADWLVTSHVAVALMVLPIVGEMAKSHSVPLETLMVPATIACSLSFCSPVSTPPNAIAFATGRLSVTDFIRAGMLVNVLGVLLTWGFSLCFTDTAFGVLTPTATPLSHPGWH
eukprot:GGOE01003870.1.p1 GENE.GGOE01003870.1~~GGOE01003870.1.p1  ORF type:complete len:535 (+),score=87.52 GGOE01003870.1:87-1691(+)